VRLVLDKTLKETGQVIKCLTFSFICAILQVMNALERLASPSLPFKEEAVVIKEPTISAAQQKVFRSPEWQFSKEASALANTVIYPPFFKRDAKELEIINTTLESNDSRHKLLDGQLGIDKEIRVTADNLKLKMPISFSIQERWRNIEYRGRYNDITVTEWNYKSDTPSELYKINAFLFVYGFYDAKLKLFPEVFIAHTSMLMTKFVGGDLKSVDQARKNKRQQSFFGFNIDELKEHGIITFHYKEGKIYRKSFTI
jgi:hypothetical protein